MPLFLCHGDKTRPFDGHTFGKVQDFSGIIFPQKTESAFKGTAAFAIRHPFDSQGHFTNTNGANGRFSLMQFQPFQHSWIRHGFGEL